MSKQQDLEVSHPLIQILHHLVGQNGSLVLVSKFWYHHLEKLNMYNMVGEKYFSLILL